MLEHIAEDLRLRHAVAVLLQRHTFTVNGPELESQLANLLGLGDEKKHVRDAALRDLLALGEGNPGIGEMTDVAAKDLVSEALSYKEEVLKGARESMCKKYGSTHNALATFADKHGKVREGIIALVDLAQPPHPATGTGAIAWAPALQGLELKELAAAAGVEGILQLLAATLENMSPQPLTVVAMRLADIPLSALSDLRYRLVRKYKSFTNMVRVLGSGGAMSQVAFTAEYVNLQCQMQLDDLTATAQNEARELFAAEAGMVFDAFDSSGEGALDASELQLAMSAAAPGASLERLRMCVLLKFGSWRNALNTLDLSADDLATPSALTAIAAPLDIPYEDVKVIYNNLDEDGDGELTWAELTGALITRAEGFSLQELTLRAWNACEAGKSFTEQVNLRLPRNFPADMPMAQEAFASKVFGVQLNSQAIQEGYARRRCTLLTESERKGSKSRHLVPESVSFKNRSRGLQSGGSSSSSKPILPTQPALSEAEVLQAYLSLWNKHNRVTMNLLLAELRGHTFVSDVLAIDRGQLHPGDTVVVKYRVPRQMEAQLNDSPFIAAVAQSMSWSAAGGGCWRLNGREVTEFAGPRIVLPSRSSGVLQVQIPDMGLDNEPLEFRLFSSPDGRKPGKQVGNGARFVLRQIPPQRPHVAAASTSPTSVRLLWEPPPLPKEQAVAPEARSFVVRGWPLDLNVSETTPSLAVVSSDAWSHRNQEITSLCSYDIQNLVPGATYHFEVAEVRRDEASTEDGERGGSEGKEGPPSNALQLTLPLRSAPAPPGKPEYLGRSSGGGRLLRWASEAPVPQDQDVGLQQARAPTLKQRLYWDIPPEEPQSPNSTSRVAPAPKPILVQRGSLSFWPFTGRYWLRDADDGNIECQAIPPMPTSRYTSASHCRFCVVAVADGHEVHGEVSEAVDLPSPEEEVLAAADDRSMTTFARAAVEFAGVNGLVDAMQRSGLAGEPEVVQRTMEQQKRLQEMERRAGGLDRMRRLLEVAEAGGGIDRFLAAMNGMDMVTFTSTCDMAKRMQQQDGKLDVSLWDRVLDLVTGGGGRPTAFLEAFEGLGHEQFIDLMPRLLREHTDKDLKPLDPWSAFAQDRSEELLRLFRDADLNAERLIQFLRDCRSSELIGQGIDPHWRATLMKRLHEVGGLPRFMSHFNGIDLRCVAGGAELLKAANLADATSLPRTDMWVELVEFIEREWGVKAGLQKIRNDLPRISQLALRWDAVEDFMLHATRIGGTHLVSEVLSVVADAGGAERLLTSLKEAPLRKVLDFLESLRRSGGSIEDLQKLVSCSIRAGSLSRMVGAIDACHMDTFLELLEELKCVQSQLRPEVVAEVGRGKPGEFAKVLQKIYRAEGVGGLAWLESYGPYDLVALGRLLPLLESAGMVWHEEEEMAIKAPGVANAQAFLQWVVQGGGTASIHAAVECVQASSMGKVMDVVRAMKLSDLPTDDIMRIVLWMQTSVAAGGGIVELVNVSSRIDIFSMCRSWQRLQEADAVNKPSGDTSPLSRRGSSPTTGGRRRPHETAAGIESVVNFVVSAGGPNRIKYQLARLDGQHFTLMVDLLEAMGLSRPPQVESSFALDAADGGAEALFAPWMGLAQLAKRLGAASTLWQRVTAVDMENFYACIDVLHSAGLVQRSSHGVQDLTPAKETAPLEIQQWNEVVKLISRQGGPGEFLHVFRNADLQDILHVAPLMLEAGMVSKEDSEDRLSLDQDAVRVKRNLLETFMQSVIDVGGFPIFWHIIKGVDLNRLTEDMHCLHVIRQKLGDGKPSSDIWKIVTDQHLLADLLDAVGTKRRADDSLTPKQQVRLAQKLREIDGPDKFMEAFGGTHLAVAREQLRALADNGLSAIEPIAELAKMGRMVRHDPVHLRGLSAIVATLVQWMSTYQRGGAATMWTMLNHQVVWLLAAITHSNCLLGPLSGPSGSAAALTASPQGKPAHASDGSSQARSKSHSAKPVESGSIHSLDDAEKNWQDVTPAKLAQFLHMLRPLGGVPGFLTAFQGLDLEVASAQARALQDATVRSVDTAQRLANLYTLLQCDATHLRGLEYLVRRFAVPALVDSFAGKNKAWEQWQLLADCLSAAARCDVLGSSAVKAGTSRALAATAAAGPAGRALAAERGGRKRSKQPPTEGEAPDGGGTEADGGTREAVNAALAQADQVLRSGTEHALDVLALGLSLDGAGGLDADPEQWATLCDEIRTTSQGLQGVLERLQTTAKATSRKPKAFCWQPSSNRHSELICTKCGSAMEYRARRSSLGSLGPLAFDATKLKPAPATPLAKEATSKPPPARVEFAEYMMPPQSSTSQRRPRSAGALQLSRRHAS